jgi:hypothetical protein
MAEKGAPFVSVIVPCFNGREHLDECLRSVLAQTEPRFEIVAVDDCSVDDSHAMLQDLAARDQRIRVFRTPSNRGVSAARNLALQQARGDFVFFLDSDDRIAPDALQVLLEAAWADRVDLVRGLHLWLQQDRMRIVPNLMEEMNHIEVHRVRFAECPNSVFFYGSWGTLFRRILIEEHTLRFDEAAVHFLGEDLLFNLAFLARVRRLTILKRHCYIWRRKGKTGQQRSQVLIRDPASVLSGNEQIVSQSEGLLCSLPTHRRWLHGAVFFDLINHVVLPMSPWSGFPTDKKIRLMELLERLDLQESVLAEPFIKGRRADLEEAYRAFYRHFFHEHDIDLAVHLAKKKAGI